MNKTLMCQLKFFALIAFSFAITTSLFAQTIYERLDAIIDEQLPYANVGVYIKEFQSGEVIYERNAEKLFNPASNMKLLVAAAVLYELGPNYRYVTSLAKQGNNIYLIFNGSPSLTVAKLKRLVLKLPQLGITNINNIILDSSRFKPPFYAPGTSYDDLGWYYAAPSSAIILNENAIAYNFNAYKLNKIAQITSQSTDNPLTIINEVLTVSKKKEKEHCSLNIQTLAANTLHLYGCIAQNKSPKTMLLAIPDPMLFASRIIWQTLANHGIEVKGKIISGLVPSNAQRLAQEESDKLSRLLAHMLEESDNLYADSLTKLLAVTLTGEGTYKQGAYSIKASLIKHTHLTMEQVKLADGVGTRYNLITPKQLVILLSDLYDDKAIGSTFLGLLPIMGQSGTLKDRMKNTSFTGKIAAKTGSMHDVSALSGYMTAPNGKAYIFSIISNGVNTPIVKAKELEEKILLTVALRSGS